MRYEAKYEVQFYKQHDDGACNERGAPMNRGWYWVQRRQYDDGAHGPWILSIGPFETKRAAQRNYRDRNYDGPGHPIFDAPDFPGYADNH